MPKVRTRSLDMGARTLPWSSGGLVQGVGVLVGVVVLLFLPQILSAFAVGYLSLILTYAVATLGMNLLMGFTGMISLGHSAFFAAGAYTSAVLMSEMHWPFLATVVGSAAVTFGAGFLLGFPAQRLGGLHFAVVTLGAAFLVAPLIKRGGPGSTFGGATGLQVRQDDSPPFGLATDQWVYYVCLTVAVIAVVFVTRVVTGPVGRAMLAAKEAPIAAGAMGVNVARLRVAVFALAAMLAGVAGSMYADAVGYIAPDSFALNLTVLFLAASVVGGARSIIGAVLGAGVVVAIPVFATDIDPALSNIIFGAALIGSVLVMPTGIAGFFRHFPLRGHISARSRVGVEEPLTSQPDAEAASVRQDVARYAPGFRGWR
jgi:branched-chain amino acid transport system permease protein